MSTQEWHLVHIFDNDILCAGKAQVGDWSEGEQNREFTECECEQHTECALLFQFH